jgi:hypothetical protein
VAFRTHPVQEQSVEQPWVEGLEADWTVSPPGVSAVKALEEERADVIPSAREQHERGLSAILSSFLLSKWTVTKAHSKATRRARYAAGFSRRDPTNFVA